MSRFSDKEEVPGSSPGRPTLKTRNFAGKTRSKVKTSSTRRSLCAATAALQAGPESAEAVSPLRTKVRPAGGWDGTPPRWVLDLEVELWVSAPEVEKVYRHHQDEFLAERTKSKERAFEAAAFAWRHDGRQWPVRWDMWNTEHPDKPFESWRAFREYALRGQRAALPRYKSTSERRGIGIPT